MSELVSKICGSCYMYINVGVGHSVCTVALLVYCVGQYVALGYSVGLVIYEGVGLRSGRRYTSHSKAHRGVLICTPLTNEQNNGRPNFDGF